MAKIQPNGVHHITLMGADRQTSMDFWEGVLGFPFVFEQPNLDEPAENHLYFEPGDGRLITIFTNEARKPSGNATPTPPGAVHHIAFNMERPAFEAALERLKEHRIATSGVKDRGFMHSIYFRDPLGLTLELATYVFEPPKGVLHSEVLRKSYEIRLAAGDYAIETKHIDQAITELSRPAT